MAKRKTGHDNIHEERTRCLPGTQIEIIAEKIPRGRIRVAIFDFDGTLSLLREGWQEVMRPLMVEMICGHHAPTEEITQAVEEYIDESTGLQTILQMEKLVEMVRAYGLVPEEQRLDAQGYKTIYNERLLRIVHRRLESLERGALQREQLLLRGAEAFVQTLYARGVTLYLASGTDRPDVQREAEILGVAQYFRGGIYGSLRTYQEYSKDQVIGRILTENQLEGPELVIFGDGPVEIRHAREYGAIGVGVASDEVKGFGLNPRKRDRLIQAGAHIIVPDFGEGEKLLAYLTGADLECPTE